MRGYVMIGFIVRVNHEKVCYEIVYHEIAYHEVS